MASSKKNWMKSLTQRKKSTKKNTTSTVEKTNKWTFWKDLKRWLHSNKIISSKYAYGNWDLSKEERAAICIQTAFRRFLARRVFRALKGLSGLQEALIAGGAQKLTPANLRCIHAFVRLQAQTLVQRGIKEKEDLNVIQASTEQKSGSCLTESATDWCNALGSIEEIQAKLNQRHEAAIKRERAIVYAFANKWRANSKIKLEDLFDHDLDNSAWTWIWLDRWISSEQDENLKPKKSKGEESKPAVTKVEIRKKVILKRWPSGKGKWKSSCKVKDNEKPLSEQQSSKESSTNLKYSKKPVSKRQSSKSKDHENPFSEVSSQNSDKVNDRPSSKNQSPKSKSHEKPSFKKQSLKSKDQEKASSEKQLPPKESFKNSDKDNKKSPSCQNSEEDNEKPPSKKQSPKSKPGSQKQLSEVSSQNIQKQSSKEQLHNASIQNGDKSVIKEQLSDVKKPKAPSKC